MAGVNGLRSAQPTMGAQAAKKAGGIPISQPLSGSQRDAAGNLSKGFEFLDSTNPGLDRGKGTKSMPLVGERGVFSTESSAAKTKPPLPRSKTDFAKKEAHRLDKTKKPTGTRPTWGKNVDANQKLDVSKRIARHQSREGTKKRDAKRMSSAVNSYKNMVQSGKYVSFDSYMYSNHKGVVSRNFDLFMKTRTEVNSDQAIKDLAKDKPAEPTFEERVRSESPESPVQSSEVGVEAETKAPQETVAIQTPEPKTLDEFLEGLESHIAQNVEDFSAMAQIYLNGSEGNQKTRGDLKEAYEELLNVLEDNGKSADDVDAFALESLTFDLSDSQVDSVRDLLTQFNEELSFDETKLEAAISDIDKGIKKTQGERFANALLEYANYPTDASKEGLRGAYNKFNSFFEDSSNEVVNIMSSIEGLSDEAKHSLVDVINEFQAKA